MHILYPLILEHHDLAPVRDYIEVNDDGFLLGVEVGAPDLHPPSLFNGHFGNKVRPPPFLAVYHKHTRFQAHPKSPHYFTIGRALADARFLRIGLFLPHKNAQAHHFQPDPGRILHLHYQARVLPDRLAVNATLPGQLAEAHALCRDGVQQPHQTVFVRPSDHEKHCAQ